MTRTSQQRRERIPPARNSNEPGWAFSGFMRTESASMIVAVVKRCGAASANTRRSLTQACKDWHVGAKDVAYCANMKRTKEARKRCYNQLFFREGRSALLAKEPVRNSITETAAFLKARGAGCVAPDKWHSATQVSLPGLPLALPPRRNFPSPRKLIYVTAKAAR